MKNRAVFLDRDDTLIVNIPYLGDPSRVKLLPGAQESLDLLQAGGFDLFLVSNQSGVGRGLITTEQVRQVNDEMCRQLGGDYFKGMYFCYAAPEDVAGAQDRKPSPGLLLRAREEHGLDLEKSFMIGDRLSDVECGLNAGCRSVLVLTGTEETNLVEAQIKAHHIAHNLLEAANWILQESGDA